MKALKTCSQTASCDKQVISHERFVFLWFPSFSHWAHLLRSDHIHLVFQRSASPETSFSHKSLFIWNHAFWGKAAGLSELVKVRLVPVCRDWALCSASSNLEVMESWLSWSFLQEKKGREQKATDKDTESVNRGFTLWGNYSLFSHHFWSVFPTKILQTQPTPH